jgi:ABC-type dipeptide/oligopeptide/nickel transport system permease subunit
MAMIDTDDRPTSLWRDAWRRLRRNRLAVAGLVVIAALVFVAAFGPWLSPYDFLSQNLDMRNQPPSGTHWLGTDDLGRDVLSRLIYGARTAFLVAVGVTVVAVAIGWCWGPLRAFTAAGSTAS